MNCIFRPEKIILFTAMVFIGMFACEKEPSQKNNLPLFESHQYVLLIHISSNDCPSCFQPLELLPAFQQEIPDGFFDVVFVQSREDSLLPQVLSSLQLGDYPRISAEQLRLLGVNWSYTSPYFFVYDTRRARIVMEHRLPETLEDFQKLLAYLSTFWK
ncbi:MAG: hypothetical protein GXO78_01845 [Calditrichaeota bacterium]|nr:hypothetical protein [Calditrichota bacterium]